MNRALAAPSTGQRGRIVYNDAPAAGGDLGWICVQSGTRGGGNAVWNSIGTITN